MALSEEGKRLNPDEYLDESAKIKWPTEEAEREKLARLVYGDQLVGSMDYWVNYAKDLLEQPTPRRPYAALNDAALADRGYRSAFSMMTAKQKRRVLMLIAKVASGVLYSSQKALDDVFELEGTLEIKLRATADSGEETEITIAPGEEELYRQVVAWTDSFSEFSAACFQQPGMRAALELSPADEEDRPDIQAVIECFNKAGVVCVLRHHSYVDLPDTRGHWLAFQDYESTLDLHIEDGLLAQATFRFFSSEDDPFYTGDNPSLIETVRTVFQSFGWQVTGADATVA